MKRNNRVFSLVFIIVLAGCGQAPEPDYGSYPPLLGKTREEVIELVGHPSTETKVEGGEFLYIEPNGEQGLGVLIQDGENRVIGFSVYDSYGELDAPDGGSIGSSYDSLTSSLVNRYGAGCEVLLRGGTFSKDRFFFLPDSKVIRHIGSERIPVSGLFSDWYDADAREVLVSNHGWYDSEAFETIHFPLPPFISAWRMVPEGSGMAMMLWVEIKNDCADWLGQIGLGPTE